MSVVSVPSPRLRMFLPKEFKVTVWSRLKPYFNELLKRPISSVKELEEWLLDRSELSAVIQEDFNWRFLHFSCDLNDEKKEDAYLYAVQEIQPKIIAFENQLDQKLIHSPFCAALKGEKYEIYLRNLKAKLRIHKDKNIDLLSETKLKTKEYISLMSKIIVTDENEELTLTQARKKLKDSDRNIRQRIYKKTGAALFDKRKQLENIFDGLLQLRHQMALNVGMLNYRDFRFIELNRFDYTVEDCVNYHEIIKKEVIPILEKSHQKRKASLNVDQLRPWDLFVSLNDKEQNQLFESSDEFLNKTIDCLLAVHPSFGECLSVVREMGHLDLNARKGKRPGGFILNMPISKVSFIFMNATNTSQDVRTMVHESGHAIHYYMIRSFDLESASNIPFEAAELVAMSMELLTMEHWDIYFDDPDHLRSAKIQQLTKTLTTLCWVATIDKFQHWIYLHPDHSRDERADAWIKIYKEFDSTVIDRTGQEEYTNYLWHRQMHIFSLPFYYIEYGFAQLGALAIWKEYRIRPEKTMKNLQQAMKLGNTKSLKEIYKTAGVDFNFSAQYVRDLMNFVHEELDQLQKPYS